MIAHLFSIPLGVYEIGPLLPDEKTVLSNLPYMKNTGNQTSTSFKILDDLPDLSVRRPIIEKINEYFLEVFKPTPGISLNYTQSWLNKTEQGEFHHRHHHPNSLVSGVYYVSTKNDTLTFINPFQKFLQIIPTYHNLFNADEWVIDATEGLLVLFPSTLDHYVRTKQGDDPRISLSFNTWPKGTIGDLNALTSLTL